MQIRPLMHPNFSKLLKGSLRCMKGGGKVTVIRHFYMYDLFDSDNPVHILESYWKDNVPGTYTKPYRTSFQIFPGVKVLDKTKEALGQSLTLKSEPHFLYVCDYRIVISLARA